MLASRRFAVLTCGGVCPGMNDVVRSIVFESYRNGIRDVYGIPYGFSGINNPKAPPKHAHLTPSVVKDVHRRGGSFIGTSRETLDPEHALDTLVQHAYDSVFIVGGNGGNTAASILQDTADKYDIPLQVIGLPKSIDNDIDLVDKCFGFETAVSEARRVLAIACNEAQAVQRGIVVVKVMGRSSGFIAHAASKANPDVDVCLIPEVPLHFDTIAQQVLRTLDDRGSCVICVAEGFHIRPEDIYQDLRTVFPSSYAKYIDPSYILRGGITTPEDHEFCNKLGKAAVHATLAGKKGITVATKNGIITEFPTKDVVRRVKKVSFM